MNSKQYINRRFRIGMSSWKLLLVFGLLIGACGNPNENETSEISTEQDDSTVIFDNEFEDDTAMNLSEIEIPNGYTVLAESEGDLDGDDIAEKVVIFDTDRSGDMGVEREIRIYTQEEGFWSLWHQFIGPVLASEHGGMMGDPFENLEVHDQRIYINHFGGSADKWHYTHEFEYAEDNWSLAAATLVFFQNCAYSETYTYDFNEHTCFYSKQIEACNDDGVVTDKSTEDSELIDIDPKMETPTMEDFTPGGTMLELDGKKDSYYL